MNLCGDAAAKLKVAPRPRRVDLLRLLAWRQRALEQGATLKGQRSRWPSNSTAAVTVTLMKSRLRRCELPRGPRPAALLWDASQEETLMRLSVDIWVPPPPHPSAAPTARKCDADGTRRVETPNAEELDPHVRQETLPHLCSPERTS